MIIKDLARQVEPRRMSQNKRLDILALRSFGGFTEADPVNCAD
jgi:hypothetical protein